MPFRFRSLTALVVAIGAIVSLPAIAEPTGGPMAYTWLGGKPVPERRPRHHIAMPKGDMKNAVIRLERRGCYGDCASYSVQVSGAGDVIYEGRCNVLITGRHTATIKKSAFSELLRTMRQADFWSLDKRYMAPVTDNPTYIITVKVGGRSKRLEDYVGTAAGMPKVGVAIENDIDKFSGVERWTTGDQSTIPALKAEGWDFQGGAAAWALAWASTHGSEPTATELLALGAPTSGSRPGDGCYPDRIASPPEAASQSRRPKLLEALAEAGALKTPGVKDEILFGAVASGSLAMVEQALKFHPDVNARRDGGNTPILWVSQGPHPFSSDDNTRTEYPAIVRALIKAGADLAAANDDGNTALHEVLGKEEAAALIQAGAPLEVKNHYGETPVQANFDEDVTLLIIDAGAQTDNRYADGKTLYDKAVSWKWTRVLARLKERHPVLP